MKPTVTMREALADPLLLGQAIPGPSWALWRILLIAIAGEQLTAEERVLFTMVTGRPAEPGEFVQEFWAIVGRRGGKTRALATFGAWLAALVDWSDCLVDGEHGVLPILSSTEDQSRRCFNHVAGILRTSPMLSSLLAGEPQTDIIKLKNGIDIEIATASFRSVRGMTAIGAICDELAYWMADGKSPDREVLVALRPSLATTGGPLLVGSSPYGRKGELWRTYRSDYGPEGDAGILVATGASRVFNPSLPAEVVERAMRRDPSSARAEYLAEFRVDLEALLTREIVEAAVDEGVQERGREPGIVYHGFTDPSGGSVDSMTLAIGHRVGDRAVVDLTREVKAPFKPAVVTEEFCRLLTAYGCNQVTGDRYGGEWPREEFRAHGIEYRLSDGNKSELYLGLVPALNSDRVTLLDDDVAVDQLVGLERRTARGGRDTVDHPAGGHDDVANCIAGVVHLALAASVSSEPVIGTYGPPTRRSAPNPLSGSYSFA